MRSGDDLWSRLADQLPASGVLWHVGPGRTRRKVAWPDAVLSALNKPIGAPRLGEMARAAQSVVVLVDDVTRPTPQSELLPPLLDALNAAGVSDERITAIIALGTHRYMTDDEMRVHLGEGVVARISVLNHAWKDADAFVDLGTTAQGVTLKVNRTAYEADLLLSVGSIVPHIYAGWGGGGKMVMPGICSHEAIGPMHSLAWEEGDFLRVAARTDTVCRREIDEVAVRVGLAGILNVVLDGEGACAWAGFGEPVATHAAGVEAARGLLVREVPSPADIVVIDARPATIEYWQGLKALAHAARAIKRGGTAILVGDFPEGIETTHPQFAAFARESEDEIMAGWKSGKITDEVAVAPLRLHAVAMAHCNVICVSDGMTPADKEKIGFEHAGSIAEALNTARAAHGKSADVGVIECGGDVVPQPKDE